MKPKLNKRALVLLACLTLVVTAAVGVTLAYIFTQTKPVENTFKPAKVSCEVVETFENNVKSEVKIKNTGDTSAYIRVAVVVTWKNDKGYVWAQAPVEEDYSITWNLTDNGWVKGTDGYYYYTKAVPPTGGGAFTDVLITEAKPLKDCPADGYTLSIEIVASAIQAEGMGAEKAQDAWTEAKTHGSTRGG